MEEKKLRQYDFLTSIFLILFGLWELSEAFKMPMKDSYGGVESVWYVSPALFPLFIGGGIILMGTALLINSIRTGGAAAVIARIKSKDKIAPDNKTIRVLTVVLTLVSFIYIYIPNVDFALSIALFLFALCTAFYPDHDEFRRKFIIHYIIGTAVFLILIATGLSDVLKGILKYNMDILTLLFYIYLNIAGRRLAKRFDIPVKLLRQVTITSIVVPLILCPIFRYFLLVPLPVEGGIIKLMNLLYYTLR
jgi:phage shock protein PspC (stress-responsive transcriptional regulator)